MIINFLTLMITVKTLLNNNRHQNIIQIRINSISIKEVIRNKIILQINKTKIIMMILVVKLIMTMAIKFQVGFNQIKISKIMVSIIKKILIRIRLIKKEV